MMRRTTFREIKHSLGRYLAILAIIALGVGFFSGLCVTKTAMIKTANDYLSEQELYDYRMVSTLGLEDADVDDFSSLPGIEYAEGAYNADAVVNDKAGEYVAKMLSLSNTINKAALVTGRFPQTSGECVVDAKFLYTNPVGSTITIVDTNTDATKDSFRVKEYTVVGTVHSSLYLNYERGSSSVGNGVIKAFIYILPEDFNMDVYTDIYCTLSHQESIYSTEYNKLIKNNQKMMEETLQKCVDRRYQELSEQLKPLGLTVEVPNTYVLTRDSNVGYACFESDSDIVAGIARVFPAFFFLVAALVCVTTMNRMVEEQRTQIGVLKALGYSEITIMGKYIIYSGSAALIGCITGFLAGSYAFPKIIWMTYNLMYGFSDIEFFFDIKLFIIALIVSLICSVGTTLVSCRFELRCMAAELIRPKSPKNGERILLERVTFIWRRLKFLYKVSIRNVMRYKKRFFMMVLGIGGCTGLIITGFGIKDSIANIADRQYGEIQTYDYAITFQEEMDTEAIETFLNETADYLDECAIVMESSIDIIDGNKSCSLQLIIPQEQTDFDHFIHLGTVDGEDIPYPEDGEIVITENIADKYHIHVGEEILIRDSKMNEVTLKVAAICRNFFMSYGFVNKETYQSQMKEEPIYKAAYANTNDKTKLHEAAAYMLNLNEVSGVSVIKDTRDRFTQMLKSLDYIVVLVIICAAVLAFIVLYNLTNINITERIREIATIKVLGFYPGETASYVFRENVALTAIGALVGIPTGYALHSYVMNEIDIDMVRFDIHIQAASYWYAILFTFAFAVIVDAVMYFKLKRINMAESLKSIE